MALVETFWKAGHKITGHDLDGSLSLGYRRFRAFFGTSPLVCLVAWDILFNARPSNSKPEHLLWALMLLKRYSIETFNATVIGVSEKTFRKWSHIFINLLADMPVLNWEQRFRNAPRDASTFISLDGTDFKIMEPSEFDPKWLSHKFNGPGLRYEIGICIRTGDIVWAHGGVPCGEWPDLRLARNAIVEALQPGEKISKKQILATHETVNRRIKQFCCMNYRFRHALYLHPRFFHAVVNLTQLMIENGEPLYPVDF
ncbi:hypothetical protein GHT06_009862 [Daphnia sinensis]|uniref:Uncharacterized protein n=1 Tax=Daphnia sinensis TaxID=1820382 RepID=A0AAD5L016_9CRUS|nr:hypothetical protein GHT06_009862 [Daphnia sinensis]